MTDGTTQPISSEDLWAQVVVAITRWLRTQRRMTKLVEAIPKAGVNRAR